MRPYFVTLRSVGYLRAATPHNVRTNVQIDRIVRYTNCASKEIYNIIGYRRLEAGMDQNEVPEGILPHSEASGLTGGPKRNRPSGAVIPVVGIGASAGGLEVFKRL